MIKKLSQHIINKLKAWEIVERPASVVKELVENSLDANAKNIVVEVIDWWKKLIKVSDDWMWISKQDLPMTIERYATSKISSYEDIEKILTYWFRGEALAAISEVSKFKIISKTTEEDIAWQLKKIGKDIKLLPSSVGFQHWTVVYVQDLFYNVSVRRKYLKSWKTEFHYIKSLMLNYALTNENIWLKLISEWKKIYDFPIVSNLWDRVLDIFWEDIFRNLLYFENYKNKIKVYGFAWNSQLSFQNSDNIYLFVNKRPVNDKILKKAILQAYYRQIPPGEYPFIILYLEVDPLLVDVNVHPRKLEVRFKDSNSIYNFVYNSISDILWKEKISFVSLDDVKVSKENEYKAELTKLPLNFSSDVSISPKNNNLEFDSWDEVNNVLDFKIIWQLWNSYILLEDESNLYIVDQHALAERIIFEKIKKDIKKSWLKPTPLLSPLILELPLHFTNSQIEEKIKKLNELGFDIWLIWDRKITIWSVPSVFSKYKIEISKLVIDLLWESEININKLLDHIWATKACKAAIKAWDKLSFEEMKKLIEDWFEYISWQFVCQHWRPSFVKIPKEKIDKMFDR